MSLSLSTWRPPSSSRGNASRLSVTNEVLDELENRNDQFFGASAYLQNLNTLKVNDVKLSASCMLTMKVSNFYLRPQTYQSTFIDYIYRII